MQKQIFKSRPYQKFAIEKIIEKPAVSLMLDMGLGKTIITLSAIQELIYNRYEVQKVLVIAPLRVAETTWLEENLKWQHLNLKIIPVLGTEEKRLSALKKSADIYVINRENVQWLIQLYRKNFPFDMVVIDESSSFKNPQAKRFKALKKIRPLIKRIVELTGTPAPNSLMDLWAQIYLLDGGERLGKTLGEYRRKYFTEGARNGYVVYNWLPIKNADKIIYKKISDICVSMKSEDYLKLPPVINNSVKIILPEKVQESYKKFEENLILSVEGKILEASSAAVLANKLLQFANGAVYDDEGKVTEIHEEKLNALAEIVESVNQPILIFYWFKHDLERLQKKFPDAVQLKSAENISDWNEGKIKMLLAHPASAGHGLNLQFGGNIIVWFSLTWSLEFYQQANKRLHRSGQNKSVIIHHIVAKNTIDETVIKVLQNKNARQENLLSALKARIEVKANAERM